MSSSLAYGFGAGGTDRWDKEIKTDALKKGVAPLLKKETYTNRLRRLSLKKGASKSRSNSLEAPADQPTTSTSPRDGPATSPLAESTTDPSTLPQSEPQPGTQISFHSLDSTSPPEQISAILSLSNTIFSATPESTKYSSLSVWQSHLSRPNSAIFFATLPSPNDEADVEPIGFVFAYTRSPSDYSSTLAGKLTEQGVKEGEILHIWLSGMVEQYRSRGVFGELMGLVEEWAGEKGLSRMSVSTVPSKFGRMFDLLKKTGWTVVDEVEGESEGEQKVVLMKDARGEGKEAVGVAK